MDSLLTAAAEALAEAGFELWLVLDRLDVAFAESDEVEGNALKRRHSALGMHTPIEYEILHQNPPIRGMRLQKSSSTEAGEDQYPLASKISPQVGQKAGK